MSEQLIWRPSWELGIESIDADHREMVRLINRLSDPADPASLSNRLLDLISHLRRHFRDEEVFLESIRYPQAMEHAREHHVQLAELVVLRRIVGDSNASALDPAELRGIKDWFFNHVIAEDRRFAAFYRGIGGRGEGGD
jgi:hemerythrin